MFVQQVEVEMCVYLYIQSLSMLLTTQAFDREAFLCVIFSLDTLTLLKGNVLVIVLSHFRGNNYLTANNGRENNL